jgi:methyl-accepting chemotaxis protein
LVKLNFFNLKKAITVPLPMCLLTFIRRSIMTSITFVSSIKARIFAGFVLMTALVIISAGVGFISVYSLQSQINTLTDVAAPTIEETDDLIAGLWESAKVANEILASEDLDEVAQLNEELLALSTLFSETRATLSEIVTEPAYIALIEKAVNEHNEFKVHAARMVEAHIQELEEEAKAKSLLDQFDEQGASLIVMLDEFATENEEEMQKAEDLGDEIVANNGSASAVNEVLGELFEKDYPVVEAALKLQRLVIEMQDTSGEYLAEEDPEALPQIKNDFDQLVINTAPFFKILSDLAESQEDKDDAVVLQASFEEWVNLANADEKLFDSYRDQLEMEYKADFYTEELEKDVDNADYALEEVAAESDAFMDSADENAEVSVESAITKQVIVTIIALVASVVLTMFFVKMIITPLLALSKSLEDIAQGNGDLTQRVDASANNEIGQLAGNFNLFVEKIQGIIANITIATDKMTNSIASVDSAIATVSRSAESQVEQTNSTAVAMEEMSSSAANINTNIQNVSDSTSSASKLGKDAKGAVEESLASIESLASDITQSSKVIQELHSEADSIGSVLTVIRGIAEQTNLLALNAAIEAARAGEQGRGFAVVADEVRTLAARTQKSTEEIQEMIERLQNGTSRAVESMNNSQANSENTVNKSIETGTLLDKISISVIDIDEKIDEIRLAVGQQSTVTDEISRNIENIVNSTSEVGQAVQESTRHASSLNDLEADLSELVKQFKV